MTLPYQRRTETPALYQGHTTKIAYDRGFFAAFRFGCRQACPYRKKGLRAAWEAGFRACRRQLQAKRKETAA